MPDEPNEALPSQDENPEKAAEASKKQLSPVVVLAGIVVVALVAAFLVSNMVLKPMFSKNDAAMVEKKEAPEHKKEKKKEPMIDGMPESFIGPMVADLTCHEVGHTLGLRHNFKASSLYTMGEINSKKIKGTKPYGASVMDYMPVNINFKDGEVQGDYTMIGVGPYDMWAIE